MTVSEKVDEIYKAGNVAKEILADLIAKYPCVKISLIENQVILSVDVNKLKND